MRPDATIGPKLRLGVSHWKAKSTQPPILATTGLATLKIPV